MGLSLKEEEKVAKTDGIDPRVTETISGVNKGKKEEEKVSIDRGKIVDKVYVIPTGIYKLDGVIGGGIPIGCMSLFWGYKGSSKTSTCMRVIGQANRRCARCYELLGECKCKKPTRFVTAYFAAEPIMFTEWSRNLGVDENYIIKVEPKNAEECFEVMIDIVRSGNVDLIVLDSIAALVPEAESDKSMFDQQQGLQARILGKFSRKVYSAITYSQKNFDRAPTFLFVNQMRMKIGMFVGNPETAPGGLAMGFAYALEVKFWASKKAETVKDDVLGEKPVAIDVSFAVDKRRYGASLSQGIYKLCLRENEGKMPGEVIDEKTLKSDAIKIGLIVRDGGYKFGDIELGKATDDVDSFLIKNKEVAEALRRCVVDMMMKL